MTNDELKAMHKELCDELSDVKTAYMSLGVMIADMRGQIDTIFENNGTVLYNPVSCDYKRPFQHIKTHENRSIFECTDAPITTQKETE